jgi:hypothetical protein
LKVEAPCGPTLDGLANELELERKA